MGRSRLVTTSYAERWLDDWTVGEVVESRTHRMDEQRIIEFAREFDPQRFHVDATKAERTIYGGLIASGWHTGSVMMRLLTEFLGESSLGSGGGEALRWSAPVRPDDELRLRLTVLAIEPSTRRPDRGTMRVRCELLNQHDAVVMSLEPALLLARRPE